MKILAFIGSPRRGGNTDILVDQVLESSKTLGHTSEKLYLYDYEISPCIDCRKCKKGDYVCTTDDGMQEIYPKIEAADVMIFGTPLYWFGPTAKMKLLIDRMRPFVANRKLEGKRGVVVVASGGETKFCKPLIEMFRLTFGYLGIEFAGKVLGQAFDKGDIRQNQAALNKARKLGASLFNMEGH